MDVSVKVALQGGHAWEFTCDEGDPMVVGLVSALPGASVDASLPADGLIQLENRSGQKLFVTRSSLVGVTITGIPAATRQDYRLQSGSRSGASIPSPFVLLPNCFEAGAHVALMQAIESAKASAVTAGIRELEFSTPPARVADNLIAAVAEAGAVLAPGGDEDRHLEVRLRIVDAGVRSVGLDGAQPDDQLAFLIVLPRQNDYPVFATLELPDQSVGLPDGEAVAVRDVIMNSNSALLYPAPTRPGTLRLTAEGTEVIVVSGSLRKGAAGGPR